MTDLDSTRHDQFLRLFTVHEPAVRGFVRSLLPTRDDAQEVMQEVALVLWRKFGDYATGEDFRKWAFGVARYEVLAYVRDKARDRHVFGPEVIELLARDAEQSASRLEAQREALEVCLEKLPDDQRSVVTQAYTSGARIDDLATRMGRTAMAVYKLLHRIRLALAACTRARLLEEGIS